MPPDIAPTPRTGPPAPSPSYSLPRTSWGGGRMPEAERRPVTSGAALEEGLGDPTKAELTAHTVTAFCEDCGTGRIGRTLRVIRWAERHGGHTGHVVPVRPWDAS